MLLAALLCIIIAMALAAVVLAPNAANEAERKRVARTENILGLLTPGILSFHADTKRLPRALTQLSFTITTADQDLCGKVYNNAAINEWTPGYTDRVHATSGTAVGIGLAKDTLQYGEVGGNPYVIIVVTGVEESEAARLDAQVDTAAADVGSAAGVVQWSAPDAEGSVTLRWWIPAPTKCTGVVSLTPPTASFTFVCTTFTCNFTDTSTDADGTITAWLWDFGDATTSTAQHPSHTYAAAGTYTVTLTVTDNDALQGSTSQSVAISNITLSAATRQVKGNRLTDLTWSGASTANVEVYRDNVLIVTTPNDGAYTDTVPGRGTYTYHLCEPASTICSNSVTVTF